MILHSKIFYLMRHGQTTDNASGMISGGGCDPDLTILGEEQAHKACDIFRTLDPRPSCLVVSSLKRTHRTGSIVAPDIVQIIDARFDERHLGTLDGKITEAQQKSMTALPDEESVASHFARVMEGFNHRLDTEACILFVCHGGTVRRVLEATGLTGRVAVGNAEIYRFGQRNGSWTVEEISV